MRKLKANGECLLLDKLYLFNNLWGEQTGIGEQYSWIKYFNKRNRNIKWTTKWNWANKESCIKSYASIVYGWHWGWKIKNNKLPIKTDAIKELNTLWDFKIRESKPGSLNITYDLWFSNGIINNENPDGEVMIWVYKSGIVPPIGKVVREIELENITWELWEGLHPEHHWPVYSFIIKNNCSNVKLDINKFIKELQMNSAFNVNYLLSIQSGIEVLSGIGRLATKKYYIDIVNND